MACHASPGSLVETPLHTLTSLPVRPATLTARLLKQCMSACSLPCRYAHLFLGGLLPCLMLVARAGPTACATSFVTAGAIEELLGNNLKRGPLEARNAASALLQTLGRQVWSQHFCCVVTVIQRHIEMLPASSSRP